MAIIIQIDLETTEDDLNNFTFADAIYKECERFRRCDQTLDPVVIGTMLIEQAKYKKERDKDGKSDEV